MSGTVYSTVFQFKKGVASRWETVNPILAAGEPGFVTDENKLKVGDGVTPWNDLPYIGEDEVINGETHYDFPSVGKVDVIYKASSEKKIYQWNAKDLRYEEVSETELTGDLADIDVINGGNAAIDE